MKRFALLLAVLLLVGCASQTQSPKQGVDTSPPEPTATVCKEGSTDKLSLAGVKLLEPAKPILQKLGDADKVSHSAKYPMQTFEYGFGSVTVWGDGDIIFSLDLKAFQATQPLGELWPGIHFGDSREIVLQQLARMGFCPTASAGDTVEFARPPEHLTLTFENGRALERAYLTYEGEPTEWRKHLNTPQPEDRTSGGVIPMEETKSWKQLLGGYMSRTPSELPPIGVYVFQTAEELRNWMRQYNSQQPSDEIDYSKHTVTIIIHPMRPQETIVKTVEIGPNQAVVVLTGSGSEPPGSAAGPLPAGQEGRRVIAIQLPKVPEVVIREEDSP